MRKLCLISVLATAISGLSKIVGSALTTLMNSIISKFAGSIPLVGKGLGTILTMPLRTFGVLLSFLGKLFIPLLIITIVLFVLLFVTRFLKRKACAKIRKKVQGEDAPAGRVPVVGSAVDVFNRLS